MPFRCTISPAAAPTQRTPRGAGGGGAWRQPAGRGL